MSQRFLEEYTQQLQSRVSEHIISRLDEDRIATLEGAVAQVRMAAKTSLRTEYLAAAGSKFFDIAHLPERGSTAGVPNRQLKSVAYLGLAAIHAHLGELLPGGGRGGRGGDLPRSRNSAAHVR